MSRIPVESFQLDLAAGLTVDRAERWNDIDRPTGMDGWILNLTTVGSGRVGRGAQTFATAPGRLLLFKPAVAHDYGVPSTERDVFLDNNPTVLRKLEHWQQDTRPRQDDSRSGTLRSGYPSAPPHLDDHLRKLAGHARGVQSRRKKL